MAPESLDSTALQLASYRQKNRMVIFAVEINFFTYRGLTHAGPWRYRSATGLGFPLRSIWSMGRSCGHSWSAAASVMTWL